MDEYPQGIYPFTERPSVFSVLSLNETHGDTERKKKKIQLVKVLGYVSELLD